MADAGVVRFRDSIAKLVPWWLSDRRLQSGKWTGYRFLWSIAAYLDSLVEATLQALRAPWPDQGTPTALPMIARSRGILRGQADTDATFAAKLIKWLDKWAYAGSARQLAIEIHEYLGNAPMIRIIQRPKIGAGGISRWETCSSTGVITVTNAAWDWDSISNPERAGNWSELFIVIYPTQWAFSGNWGDGRLWGARNSGIGHRATRQERDAVHALISQWKSAHTLIRSVIWTSDPTLFDPTAPLTCPDGTWGQWGGQGNGSRTASGRNTTSCRYWELP